MKVIRILHDCIEKYVKVFSIKENYEIGDNINSKLLAFTFSLSAEIERQLITQRTREALARKKSEGKKLARSKGSLLNEILLKGKEEEIKELFEKKVLIGAISKIYGVYRVTINSYVKSRNLIEKINSKQFNFVTCLLFRGNCSFTYFPDVQDITISWM